MRPPDAGTGGTVTRNAPRVFYVFVGEEDSPRLEGLLSGADLSWGLSELDRDTWRKMRPGDIVYMGLFDSPTLRACCRVSKIAADPGARGLETGERWKGRTRIVYFSHVRHVGIYYKDFERYTVGSHEPPRTLFRVPDGWAAHVLAEMPVRDAIFEPAGMAAPVDLIGPPDCVHHSTTRAIRDTAASRELKERYGNRCQVCGYTLETASGTRYSEVHHLHPLHEGGSDTPDNMVVLCAKHHAEFDYGALCVDTSGRAVGRGDADGKELRFEPDHALAPENVTYGMLKLNSVGS
ncbi:MAG: HNH endonuclease [Thaumarchaeota archaeon]|nr:HNH endonuclease [Nitrososphaerota archaeon]